MFKKKELEFNINGNILEISDFTWWIDKINAIYVDQKPVMRNDFSIFIETDNETDMLYFTSSNFKKIMKEFTNLCNGINEENGSFGICGSKCFNFNNIQDIQYVKYFNANEPCYFVQIKFKSGKIFEWDFVSEEQLKILLTNFNKVKEINNNIGLQQ